MLITKEISFDDFLRVFKKKFDSFCEKSPLTLSYDIEGKVVFIKDHSPLMEEGIEYSLDIDRKVETNIYEIRLKLEEHYPVISESLELSYDELRERVLAGEEQPSVANVVTKPTMKIVKVINDNNQVIVETESKKKMIVTMKTSVYAFLKEVVYVKKENNEVLLRSEFEREVLQYTEPM